MNGLPRVEVAGRGIRDLGDERGKAPSYRLNGRELAINLAPVDELL